MYLMQLDNFTGLIKEDEHLDGWRAVDSFRNLVNDKRFGLKALTCVALVVDYGSIIEHYSDKERPLKAMEIIYHSRTELNWNLDEIQLACIHYKEFQYNANLEERALLNELKTNKLEEIRNAETTAQKAVLLKELNAINDLVDSFDKKHGDQDLYAKSPVRNGYTLSRLEVKLLDPKSFYYERRKREDERLERDRIEKQRIKDELKDKGDAEGTGTEKPKARRKPSAKAKPKTTGAAKRKPKSDG